MAKTAQARRYAQAVFEIALEKNELDKWQADLSRIAVLGEDPEVAHLLENPKLTFENKKKVLASVIKDVSPSAMNLVYMLVTKGNITLVTEISNEYQALLDKQRGIERASVITAVPIDEADKKQLETRLGAVVNKKVIVKSEVDPEMLGGIVARIGGRQLDGSVWTRLAALKNEIAKMPR